MSSASSSSEQCEAGGGRIVRVGRGLLVKAASRLVADATPGGPDRADQFLSSAQAHGLDLRNMWASVGDDDAVGHVCLIVPGAGRTGMYFTSRPASDGDARELGRVIERASLEMGAGVVLGQALLGRGEERVAVALLGGGFQRIARLWYLMRPTPSSSEFGRCEEKWPEGIGVATWKPGDDEALQGALERTYEGTLDCPELSKMRRPEDIVESHRATGQWDRRFWWLVRLHGRAEGAMLFNPSPDQGTIELVYLGLSPALRGLGLGAKLLECGLSRLSGRRERSITCAVDERNTPATLLYERFGFERFDERVAYVRSM